MTEQVKRYPTLEDQQSWKSFNNWFNGLRPRERQAARFTGQFPEGTPDLFRELYPRTTHDERRGSLIGNFPSIESVLGRTDEDLNTVRQEYVDRYVRAWASFIEPVGEVGVESTDEVRIGPSSAESRSLLREQIEDVLLSLNSRERRVIELRFGLDTGRSMTLEEVGKEIKRSKSTAWRIEHTALKKLRTPSRIKTLKDYLEE